VLQPFLVIALVKVVPEMCTPRLLVLLRAVHGDGRVDQQVLQLQGLHQVGVPHPAAVGEPQVGLARHDVVNLAAPRLQGLLQEAYQDGPAPSDNCKLMAGKKAGAGWG